MSPPFPLGIEHCNDAFLWQVGNKVTAMHILLLNLGMKSAQDVKQALSGQGYEITTGLSPTVDEIHVLFPEVLIAEATPSDLGCCGLISQIKADPDLRSLRNSGQER